MYRSPWSPGVILLGAKIPAFKVELSGSMYFVYTSQFEINYPSSTSFQPTLTQFLSGSGIHSPCAYHSSQSATYSLQYLLPVNTCRAHQSVTQEGGSMRFHKSLILKGK
jgi:hypothetical protein